MCRRRGHIREMGATGCPGHQLPGKAQRQPYGSRQRCPAWRLSLPPTQTVHGRWADADGAGSGGGCVGLRESRGNGWPTILRARCSGLHRNATRRGNRWLPRRLAVISGSRRAGMPEHHRQQHGRFVGWRHRCHLENRTLRQGWIAVYDRPPCSVGMGRNTTSPREGEYPWRTMPSCG